MTPGAGVSPALVSSRGQIALIADGILQVEDVPGSGRFLELARYVRFARWSPDGMRLLFDLNTSISADNTRSGDFIDDYQLWSADQKLAVSLSTLVREFPGPPYLLEGWIPRHESGPAAFRPEWIDYAWKQDTTTWGSDSQKILFVNLVSPEHLPVSFPGSQTVSVADLESGSFTLAAEAVLISALYPLEGDTFLLQDHCGSPCEWLTAYDLQGEKRWELPWVTTGFFALASDLTHLVNAGRIAINEPTQPNTLDLIDTSDGAVKIIYELGGEEYFPLQSEQSRVLLSADGQYASFNIAAGAEEGERYSLAVVRMDGEIQTIISNAIAVAWNPSGALTLLQLPDPGQPGKIQLVNWSPGETTLEPVYGPVEAAVIEGAWSPDGQILAFCSFDPAEQTLEMFSWRHGEPQPTLVKSAPSPAARLCNLTWLPDSNAIFFNLTYPNGMLTPLDLWKFDVISQQAGPVARSAALP